MQTPPAPQRTCTPHHRGSSLDELPEFSQRVLESLRQPLEDGTVVVSRTAGGAAFPARFQLAGAANRCRRGCASLEARVCTAGEKRQYLARLSRPLLDRIDLHLDVRALPYGEISGATIDADARPLARPRSVAIPWGDSGGFCGFLAVSDP